MTQPSEDPSPSSDAHPKGEAQPASPAVTSPGVGASDEHANPFSPFALVVLFVLVVGGIWLIFKLKDMAATQDCVWSGRKNCVEIEPNDK